MKQKKFNPRQFAESLWGNGGTHAAATNRKGTYYYSCSGHGGFVIPKASLTKSEIEKLSQYEEPLTVPVLKGPDGLIYGIDYAFNAKYVSNRRRTYLVPKGSQWETIEVFVFEEDCAWSLVYLFTDIRLKKDQPGVMKEAISTFNRWYNKQEVQNETI